MLKEANTETSGMSCPLPGAKDSHNVAMKMHNTFIKNVVSTERIPLKAISVAKLISEL